MSLKFYCDKCGKEIEKNDLVYTMLWQSDFARNATSTNIVSCRQQDGFHLCFDCWSKVDDYMHGKEVEVVSE